MTYDDWRKKRDASMGELMGQPVIVSRKDGIPVKNRLPVGLACSLRTEGQWEELGYRPDEGAKPFQLHPSVTMDRTSGYFHSSQVADADGNRPEEVEEYRRREAAERSLYAQCSGQTGRVYRSSFNR